MKSIMKSKTMKFLVVTSGVLFICLVWADQSEIWQDKSFQLSYIILGGKAVCYETCRRNCEESSPALFMDYGLYKKTSIYQEKGYKVRFNKMCSTDGYGGKIPWVQVNMAELAKNNPRVADEMVLQKGTTIRALVHTDIQKDISEFMKNFEGQN